MQLILSVQTKTRRSSSHYESWIKAFTEAESNDGKTVRDYISSLYEDSINFDVEVKTKLYIGEEMPIPDEWKS